MPVLTLTSGEGVLLWLRDRSHLSAGMPVADLRQAFQTIGIACETRFTDEVEMWEIAITPRECTQPPPPPQQSVAYDGFVLTLGGKGLRLTGNSARSLAFSIWEILERMGWEWPTPQIWREPRTQSWSFEEGIEIHPPALQHRILFAEQVEITPDIIRWLSRLRFNTLFPSNPSRFTEPEEQFPEESLNMAQNLGFDLIAGGDCLAWLLAPLGLEGTGRWEDLQVDGLEQLIQATRDLWRDMEEPKPRLSVWPGESDGRNTVRFLQALLASDHQLLLETELGVLTGPIQNKRLLFQYCIGGLPREWEIEAIQKHLSELEIPGAKQDLYLFLDTSRWDQAIGNLVTPLLWRLQGNWIEAAAHMGWGGAALSLVGLPTDSYLERAGFSLASCARTMWTGNVSSCLAYNEALIRSQFEAGAGAVNSLLADAMEFGRMTVSDGSHSAGRPLERVHDFLVTEQAWDQFDQHAAELEESPPSEACLELARSLSTLAALHELEDCHDVHEERALARSIWTQHGIDRWPAWLQETSPLAEQLRLLLK